MKAKIIILFLSVIVSMAFIAAGYGFWEQALTVTAHITVTRPEDTISRVVPKLTPGAIDLIQGRIKINPGTFDNIIPDRADITTHGSIDKPTPGGNDKTVPGSIGTDATGGTGSGESTASGGTDIAGPDGNGEESPVDVTPELDESSVKTQDSGTVVDGQPVDTNGQPDSTDGQPDDTVNSSDNAAENSTDIGSGNNADVDNTGSVVNTPADTATDPVPQSGNANDDSVPHLLG